ncbi:AraC-like DNA-binding protein [Lysobacter niastensis]|uniref:AraC-like DNA-binding protein n=1 Tax=Lysobacter niastensis TaxID=380629 RepID=A0ABU1WCZ0_9GAMM|nr:helix-turn-helix domain-containing protein [Lysobacter niastensis]MDR7135458.1 AraC-like DNA-binding protein [Lysobacter niastensis]
MSRRPATSTINGMHDHVDHETRHSAGDALCTHRHVPAYAALVLEGGYVEASADGPVECTPGTLVLHPRYHAHGNRFGRRGARVANLALPAGTEPAVLQVLRVPDRAEAGEVFLRGAQHLHALILASNGARSMSLQGWQVEFLHDLQYNDEPIARIARRAGVSDEHASRMFLRTHGMSPQSLRRELRGRQALSLLAGEASLADIAARSGFADQSHLTRSVRAMTGLPPGRLRRQINCVQDAEPAPMR